MTYTLITANSPTDLMVPGENLDQYLQKIRQIPVLSAEEEHALALRFQKDNDLTAARHLVVSHLRFVAHIARGYSGYGLPLSDLIQEGAVGLMKAVKRFDPSVGVRLVSFAVHWIRAEMHEHILRNWRIVKVATTKAQRKLFFNLRSAKKRLGWLNQSEVNTVAEDLGVSPETVLEMEQRLSGADVSFDPASNDDDDDAHWTPSLSLVDPNSQDPATVLEDDDWSRDSQSRLADALAGLGERDRIILEKRWLAEKKSTLHELADEFNVSAERIRQLEKNAIGKLQKVLV